MKSLRCHPGLHTVSTETIRDSDRCFSHRIQYRDASIPRMPLLQFRLPSVRSFRVTTRACGCACYPGHDCRRSVIHYSIQHQTRRAPQEKPRPTNGTLSSFCDPMDMVSQQNVVAGAGLQSDIILYFIFLPFIAAWNYVVTQLAFFAPQWISNITAILWAISPPVIYGWLSNRYDRDIRLHKS
jgi:hypothetical protein